MYEAAKKLFIKEITLSISIKCLLLMRGCHSCNIRTDLKTQSAGWLGNTASIVNTIIRVSHRLSTFPTFYSFTLLSRLMSRLRHPLFGYEYTINERRSAPSNYKWRSTISSMPLEKKALRFHGPIITYCYVLRCTTALCTRCVHNSYIDIHQQLRIPHSDYLCPSAKVGLCNISRYFFWVLPHLELVVKGGPGRGRMRGSKSNTNGSIEESMNSLDFLT
jgi:hypothetical protein